MFNKELLIAIRKNFVVNLLSSVLIYAGLILIFVMLFYMDANRVTSLVHDERLNGMQVFQLVEDMFSPRSAEGIVNRRDFFRSLSAREEFGTVIYYEQGLVLSEESFRSESLSLNIRLGVDWNEATAMEVLLINQEFLAYFPLVPHSGRAFEALDFESFDGIFPLVAGFDFRAYYSLGDVLEGKLFNHPFQFEIVGFLKDGHHQPPFGWGNDANTALFLPFIDFEMIPINEAALESSQWEGFLWDYYLNALQPLLVLDDSREAIDITLNAINSLEEYYGLNMVFTMTNPRLFRNQVTRNIITMNLQAIALFLMAALVLITAVLFYFSKIKYYRKEKIYSTLSLLGVSKYKQFAMIMIENFCFTLPMIFLAVYYLIFWSDLVTHWTMVSHLFTKAEMFNHALLNFSWPLPTQWILWQVIGIGLIFYLMQNIYPIWKIDQVHRGKEPGKLRLHFRIRRPWS